MPTKKIKRKQTGGTFKKSNLIIGVIAPMTSGKTTLMNALLEKWPDVKITDEEFDTNPYLAKAYRKPQDFSFRSQLHQLFTKVEATSSLSPDALNIIIPADSDRIYEETYYEMGYINEEDHKTYTRLFNLLKERGLIVKPEVILFLNMDKELAPKRMVERGRDFEKVVNPEFLSTLWKNFQDYIQKTKLPVISIATGEHDFRYEDVREKQAKWISSQINLILQKNKDIKTNKRI